MNKPRTSGQAAECRAWLRVIELESRYQPSLVGLSADVPILSSLVNSAAPVVSTITPSIVGIMPNTESAAASTSTPPADSLNADVSKPLVNVTVAAQPSAVTDPVQTAVMNPIAQVQSLLGTRVSEPPVVNSIAEGQNLLETNVSQPLGIGVSVSPASTTVSVTTPPTNTSVPSSGGTNGNGVALPPSVPVLGSVPDTPITSPVTPVAPAIPVATTPVTLPATTPIVATPSAPATGTVVVTAPVDAGGFVTPFVLNPGTPAISAGGPTGGTGTVALAAAAVPAGTAIGPNVTGTSTANVTGANTGVLLMPSDQADNRTAGGTDATVAKAGLPTFGVRWDGYVMAVIGAAYGAWHWKRRVKAVSGDLPRLAVTAPAAN